MPTCPTCGSQDFELYDGHYFCNECSTQSQEIHEQVEDEEALFNKSVKRKRISEPSRSASKKGADVNAPEWFTCEAINLFIYHQVEALIKLGASPRLKNIVMELWFQYLRSLEIAFSDKEDWVPRLPLRPTYRDLYAFNQQNPKTSDLKLPMRPVIRYKLMDGRTKHEKMALKIKGKLSKKKLRSKKAKMTKTAPTSDSDCEILSTETETKTKSTNKAFSISDLKNYSKLARRKLKKHGIRKIWQTGRKLNDRSVDHITMSKTICFCYIGLLLLQEQMTLADIMRWIREGHFPYFNCIYLLPESMTLCFKDLQVLKKNLIPSANSIIRESLKLLILLEKTEIPSQPVFHFAVRFIMDLNLPNELASVIHRLSRIIGPELSTLLCGPFFIASTSQSTLHFDCKAASLIIIVLKIIFGLNGKTERELSLLAKEANSNAPTGRQVFVWDDWENQMSLNLNFQKCKNVSSVFYSAKDALDVGNLYTLCKEMRFKRKMKNFTPERKTLKGTTVSKAFATLADQKHFVRCRPNCFPITTSMSECVSGEHEVTFFLRDFSACTLPSCVELDTDFWLHVNVHYSATNKAKSNLKTFPSSLQVLVNALCYVTNSQVADILSELRRNEKLIFTLLAMKENKLKKMQNKVSEVEVLANEKSSKIKKKVRPKWDVKEMFDVPDS